MMESTARIAGTAILLALLFGRVVNAQGSAPFWQPASSPAPELSVRFMDGMQPLWDLGRNSVYILAPLRGPWLPLSHETRFPWPDSIPRTANHYLIWGDSVVAWNTTSVFLSSDRGRTWTVTTGLEATAKVPIRNIVRTTRSRCVALVGDSALFISSNGFQTSDTAYCPQRVMSADIEGDTVLAAGPSGTIWRSVTLGLDWNTALIQHDTLRNTFIVLRSHKFVLLWEARLSKTFPYGYDSCSYLLSTDRGLHWRPIQVPDSGKIVSEFTSDTLGTLYLSGRSPSLNIDCTYRSRDTGKAWHLIMDRPILFVGPTQDLYALAQDASALLLSTDKGDTWDTLPTEGIQNIPFDAISLSGELFLRVRQGVFRSTDTARTWRLYTKAQGPLGVMPTTPPRLTIATTFLADPVNPNIYTGLACGKVGPGVITTHLKVWVAYRNGLYSSIDTGQSVLPWDSVSMSPLTQVLETSEDTILAVSSTSIMKGYDWLSAFENVTPEPAGGSMPTAIAKDSLGRIWVAMSDGKLFSSSDPTYWIEEPSPATDAREVIKHLTASPNGSLFAVDSNLETGLTDVYRYTPALKRWLRIDVGLARQGFDPPCYVANVWYASGFLWAGTQNMGLFRSRNSVTTQSHVSDNTTARVAVDIYPNPAIQFVTITFAMPTSDPLSLVNGVGQICHIAQGHRSVETIDVRRLPSGPYSVWLGGHPVGRFVVSR